MANGELVTLNICEYIENKIEGFGETKLKRAISAFSSIDPRVEFSAKCCVLSAKPIIELSRL